MFLSGTRQKAYIHVEARVATSCRHTVPLRNMSHILLGTGSHADSVPVISKIRSKRVPTLFNLE